MEHSLLHALQLFGAISGVGGAVLMLAFVHPTLKRMDNRQPPPLAAQLDFSVSRWIFLTAIFATGASVLNVLVDVAEAEGLTLFGGVNFARIWIFLTRTSVGHISMFRFAALLLVIALSRFHGRWKWGCILIGAFAAAVCESLMCHAAAQPSGRISAIMAELIHILLASLWLGALLHLFFARWAIEAAIDDGGISLVAGILRRFSPMAMTAVGMLALSGFYLALRYLVTPIAVVTSAYGLTLMVKLALLVPLLWGGRLNYNLVKTGLKAAKAAGPEARRALLWKFGKGLEFEVTAGTLVITVAGILASVSPPVGLDTLRLAPAQTAALVTPHLPRTEIPDPRTFSGAEERTTADLHYAEFTHNCSGVMVVVLGSCWLLVSLGGRPGQWADRLWPALLLPFPFFIAVAADPEVWWLRTVTFLQALQDPQMLEHQLAAILMLILICLGWLDGRLPPARRPLGYALPAMMILGSLLLLGHAHSNFTTSQELTNLINVQHAIFGAFGLFAGLVRWLQLRGLFPDRPARIIWPGLVIGLGLFMTFCYRETV